MTHAQAVTKLFRQGPEISRNTERAGLEESSQTLDKEIESTYKRFYDFIYQDLPYCWRQLYTDLSILKFIVLLTMASASGGADQGTSQNHGEHLDSMVSVLDKALILAGGAGISRGRKTIERMIGLLEDSSRPDDAERPETEDQPPAKRQKTSNTFSGERSLSAAQIFKPPTKHLVKRFDHLSMDEFQKYMDHGHAAGGDGPLPFVVRGVTDEWPAMTTRPWRKPAYLLSKTFGGRRLVPVEVGRSYVDDGWGQELITFRELLERIETPSPESGEEKGAPQDKPLSYLAQHELFTQLPSLRNDIPTPDLCYTSPPPHPLSPSLNKPELPLPLINAWLGPAGTITPLHTDGYHNLLAQVVGAKYVRLYSPLDSEALCPRGEDEHGIDMHNTSAFDVGVIEGWDKPPAGEEPQDDIELEEFRELRCWEAVLEEGDVLYVPIGWWHYVRSLSVSFSVSFWWNGPHGREETPGAE